MHCGVSLGGFHSQQYIQDPVRFLPQKTAIGWIGYFYPRSQAVYDKPFSEAFVIN